MNNFSLSLPILTNFPFIAYLWFALLGACLGSFAGVVISRIPLDLSSVTPRSFCHFCEKKLPFYLNIPIFSWIFLKGRCFFCSSPIGFRSLFIELLFVGLSVGLLAKYGLSVSLIEKFIFCFLLICIAYIDMDFMFIPLSLLFWLILLGVLSTTFYYFYPHEFVPSSFSASFFPLSFYFDHNFSALDRFLAAFFGSIFFSLLNIFATFCLRKTGRLTHNQWAMGWGDPLLIFAIGLFVGSKQLVGVIFLASFLGSIVGLMQILFSVRMKAEADVAKGAIAYGPFLAVSAMFFYLS